MPDTAVAHQVRRPQGLSLPEEAHLGGKRVTKSRARVYHLLRITRERDLSWPVGRHQGPEGWVPTYVLREPWAGGQAGDRRLRELRCRCNLPGSPPRHESGCKYGVRIARKRFQDPVTGATSETWLWRLEGVSSAGTPAAASPRRNAPAHPPTPREADGAAPAPASTPTPAPSSHPDAPLARLGVWLVKEGDAGALKRELHASVLWDVTPGGTNWLAPPSHLEHRLAAGELTHDQATELYRQELLRHYRSGRMVRELGGHRRIVVWTGSAVFDPFPMLARALEALGATVYHHEPTA